MFKITITEVRTTDTPTHEWREDKTTDRGYAYVPHPTRREEVRRDVLVQEVETLDLPAVIKAVNGL